MAIQSARSQTEQRAISLLGSGCSPGTVATAIGVSESRISQLMADADFAKEVSDLRFQNLNKHNEHDSKLDEMEAMVIKNLKEVLPIMMRPMELLKAAQVLNGMKRRGQSAPEQLVQQNQVVTLVMPNIVVQKFTTNVNNQVIHAGGQTLETIQGSTLLAAAKAKQGLHNEIREYTRESEINPTAGNPKQISG